MQIRFYTLFMCALIWVFASHVAIASTPEDRAFNRSVRTLLRKHCTSCHNEADKKAGINLDRFDFVVHVIRSGELFQKVIESVEDRQMPPPSKSHMTNAERDTMIAGIRRVLDKALLDPDPGPTVMRRLSHREYGYTIQDLIGVPFDAKAYFPTEASGGEGFDNQSRVLYLTPLLMERYYAAADSILRDAKKEASIWDALMPKNYRPSVLRRLINWWKTSVQDSNIYWTKPAHHARKVILPFATKAYRKILSAAEEDELISFFEKIYFKEWKNKNGFENAIETTFKKILVSPNFLFRMEANQPIQKPYAVNNFELATRLSYFLWSSMPDDTLFRVAYQENLHNKSVLTREAKRMMASPKFKRFSETFAPQWLGIEDILLPAKVDLDKYPSFTTSLKEAMYDEVVEYFAYVFEEGNLMQLIASDFSFVNQELSQHYGMDAVEGDDIRKVSLPDAKRGGILGMGAVLTATSLPGRTSPVLRGHWVLSEVLGTRVPPPPPDVPELEAAKNGVHNELDLRALLERHRFPSTCQGCHKKMDPIGFGLENYDAIGRWRDYYDAEVKIDAKGTLEDGSSFEGPGQLKQILMSEQDKFAATFSRKLLSYALGRGVGFIDTPSIENLTNRLIESNFNGEDAIISLITSYPFRHRRSDTADQYKDNVL